MNQEEAIKELSKRFPKQTVNAITQVWYRPQESENIDIECSLYWNFTQTSCQSMIGKTWEECFAKIDIVDKEIDQMIAKYSILLRKF